jgi:integrase
MEQNGDVAQQAPMLIKRKYMYSDIDRFGNERVYLCRKGQPKLRVRAAIGSAEFDQIYHKWLSDATFPPAQPKRPTRLVEQSLRWLVVQYYGSVAYKRLDPRTQHVSRLIVDKIMAEPIAPGSPLQFGDCPLDRFDAKAVRIIRDRRADRPDAANNRVRRIRQIYNWALEVGVEGVRSNPARNIRPFRPTRPGGFPEWTEQDIVSFEARHAIGTRARLAMALLLYTGVRRSDVIRLGKQHMQGGVLVFRQYKGRNTSPLTLQLPILSPLASIIASSPVGDLAFLVNERGQPFSAAGFGNWFRRRCNEAGLRQLSAHGLRKAGANRAAEAGASAHQLMAIFGWRALRHAEAYTRGAERKRLARDAMHLLAGTERDEKFPTSEGDHKKWEKEG